MKTSPPDFETRRVEPELLETYPADHPAAVRGRADLRLVNAVMGNHRWIVRRLRRLCQPGWRVTEIGAGDGALSLRLARRGMDPAREITAALAAHTGLPAADPLRRRDIRRQRGGGRERRMKRPPRIIATGAAPEVAVLVDDVVTTGATLDSSARALRLAGALRVRAVALAAVPSLAAG